jgi:hypothetical protein
MSRPQWTSRRRCRPPPRPTRFDEHASSAVTSGARGRELARRLDCKGLLLSPSALRISPAPGHTLGVQLPSAFSSNLPQRGTPSPLDR